MFASSFAHAKRQILTFVIKLFCACFWLDKTREWCPYLKRFSFTKSAFFHSEFYILVRCNAHESTCFQRAWPVKEGMRALVETTTATRYCLEFKCLTTLQKIPQQFTLFPLKKNQVIRIFASDEQKEWNLYGSSSSEDVSSSFSV